MELRVLLVEDHPGDARLVQEALREIAGLSQDVTHVTTLAAALDAVASRPFDIGLLDLGLPDARGIEVVQRLHQAVPDLALVVLSGLKDEEVAIQALQEGGQDYLVKSELDSRLLWRATRYAVERQRLQLELRSLSLVDDLTGLNNRKGFVSLATHHILVALRNEAPFLVGFIDLDGMKHINDTFGHQEGNRALVETAAILRDSFRQSDVLARFGGDEFVVLVSDAREVNAPAVRARVEEKLCAHNATGLRPYALSLSIGIVSSESFDTPNLEQLLAHADARMYEDKRVRRTAGPAATTGTAR